MTDKVSAALAFAYLMAVEDGEVDKTLQMVKAAILARQELINHDKPPRKKLPQGQVWAWMNGPGTPHWEVRWTGAKWDGHDDLST